MPRIYDIDGAMIANIPISEKQLETINDGITVRIIFTTPQTMIGRLGRIGRQGSFAISMLNGKITSDDPETVKRFDELMKAVDKIRNPVPANG